MTLEALAFTAGISTGAITRIEREVATPTWVTVNMLIDALDVTLVDLAIAVEAQRQG
jgi:DNA-binding XRE family transcriptional regulator